MKIFLIIVIILLAITALLCTSVIITVRVDKDGKFKFKLRWLFFTMISLPKATDNLRYNVKAKKDKPKAERVVKKKNEESTDKPNLKLKSLSSIKGFIEELVPYLQKVFGDLIGTVRVRKLHVTVIVADKDSAQTAIQYGRISAVCANALSRLDNLMRLHDTVVTVEPDFWGTEAVLLIDARFKVRFIALIIVVLKNLFKGFNIFEQAMQTFFTNNAEKGKKTK